MNGDIRSESRAHGHKHEEAPQGVLKLEENLAYRVSMLAFALGKAVAQIYTQEGLTAHQWKVMSVLCHYAPLRASQIENFVTLDKSAISRNLQALVAAGCVRRMPDPDHGKAAHVEPTPLGRRMHARIAHETMALQRTLLEPFTADEVNGLFRAIGILETRLDGKLRALPEGSADSSD